MVPRILIVVDVPPDPEVWIVPSTATTALHRCAYWVSLAGAAQTENTGTVTVAIPRSQVFDTEALKRNLLPTVPLAA